MAQANAIEWQTWSYTSAAGFTLRGQHTVPRGLPVLHFIHGNSYSGLTYLPLWQSLAPHYDIFLHDVQGHGDSDQGGDFIGWNASAELAVEVVEKVLRPTFANCAFYKGDLYKGPVYGIGHSFGGILTLLMSERNPALFDRLLLLDPILFPRRMLLPMRLLSWLRLYSLNPYAKRARKRRSRWHSREAAYKGLEHRGMFKGWSDDALHAYVDHAMHKGDHGEWELKCSPHREAEIFSSYAHRLWPYISKKLAVPTDVWAGRNTYPFARRAFVRWAQLSDRVQLHWVDGGHCFMQEAPERTAQEIEQALRQGW